MNDLDTKTKYAQIRDVLHSGIVRGRWKAGEQVPSARELGQEYSVSMLTARKAVTELIERGMLEGRPGVGTFVAAAPTFHRVGLVLGVGGKPEKTLDDGQYLRLVERGFRSWASQRQINVATYLYQDDDALWLESSPFRRDVESGVFDGVILAAVPWQVLALELLRRRVPVVAVGSTPRSVPYHVKIDFRRTIHMAVTHAVQCGRRRIGLLTGGAASVSPARTLSKSPYYDSFTTACLELGADVCREWIHFVAPVTVEAGHREMSRILNAADRPDVLIVTDDVLARGVLDALVEHGVSVPGDLALIVRSNAGAPPFEFPVSLTRLELDPAALIGEAADMLADLMSGGPPNEATRRMAARLVVGESC